MTFSLRTKVILFIVFMMLFIGAAGGIFSKSFVNSVVTNEYKERSRKIASVVAGVVDPDKVKTVRDAALEVYEASDTHVLSDEWGSSEFDAYVAQYKPIEQMDEYKDLLKQLQSIQQASEADAVYLAYVDPDDKIAMYLVDGSAEDVCPVGCLDHYEAGFTDRATMEATGIPPYETRTNAYGWLITAGVPIRYNDEVVAYAYDDLSMDYVESVIDRYSSIGIMAIIICLILVCAVGVFLMNQYVVNPIRKLTDVASKYRIVNDKMGNLESSAFSELNIKTGDEIEVLAESMKKLEADLNDQIENLFATRQELISTREHADIMSEMANRDALTGIRNKRGYETEIQRINKGIAMGNTKVGVVMVDMNDLKEVNDQYGHEKGDKVICSLCDMLCSVFKRSPVFRIGGDEFVVIVSNFDYINLESNVDKFKKSVEHNIKESELEPWERASAAIGYAIFEEGRDIAIEDTLKRADEQMYACKQEMKEKYNSLTEMKRDK